MTTVRIIGPGRAGRSFAQALAAVGVKVSALLGRDDEIWEAGEGVDLVLLAVPDRAVPVVAGAVRPVASTVVAHCSGVTRPRLAVAARQGCLATPSCEPSRPACRRPAASFGLLFRHGRGRHRLRARRRAGRAQPRRSRRRRGPPITPRHAWLRTTLWR